MRPLSYLLLVTLALATGGQAVVHGNRNGYRYNGPSHKYLPAEGAPSTDAITTTGHWQPQVHGEQREREPDYLGNRQEHWQHQQSGHKESSSLGHHQQHQQGLLQHVQPLQEVEYLIHQQRPQGFSQYQGNRQSESSYGQQQQQHHHENHQEQHSENHWDSSSHHHQQQGPHKEQQQHSENHWDSSSYQHQQQGPHKQQQQPENHWQHQQHDSHQQQQQQQQLQSYWESSFGNQHQQQGSHQKQKENNWESSYGQQGSQHQPENHWSGPLSSNNIHGSHGSNRWQPSHSSYPLQSLDLLPVAHAHANSQKTLARPTNHVNQIPGYTLSSNPEHERFIGLDAADNRLLTQSLPFQSPSAPFRPGSNHHQQQQQQQQGQSSIGNGHSHNFLQMQSQSYELPPTQHSQHGWVASQSANSHANEPNRQFQPPYY